MASRNLENRILIHQVHYRMSEPDRQYAMTFHPEASEPYLLQNTGLQPAGPGRHTGIMILL